MLDIHCFNVVNLLVSTGMTNLDHIQTQSKDYYDFQKKLDKVA